MMRARDFAASLAATLAIASPAVAEDQSMHGMPGMSMPAPVSKAPTKAKPPAKRSAQPASNPALPAASPRNHSAVPGTQGMDHSSMQGMRMQDAAPSASPPAGAMQGMTGDEHAGHAMPGMQPGPSAGEAAPKGTDLPAGDAPAPAPPMDHYADRFFSKAEMDRARHIMMTDEGGGRTYYQVMFNLAEYQARKGRDGYRWDGEAWFGGDINRLTLKTEGEGAFHEGVESAEVQALYSRAIGPYFNLQAGVRHDFQPGPARTYATVGFEGLAPYWFEVEGALFLSDKGDLLGRLEGYYDQRITQRLILQPRIEFNLAAQDVPENRIGSGLSNAELGLRLRYEIAREFAPYIGVSYDRKIGDTARFARLAGEDVSSTSLVMGVRFWF
ncbi:copper resistance protein B [Sphingomonas horti]|jgi:copper resistance protein B